MNKIKNSNEKLEVFKTIWKIANDLRGKVSGWEFKSYVLGALCYRCLSENISSRINNMAYSCGDYDFNYANCSDDEIKSLDGFRERYISEIGFFLYPSELFCNVLKNAPKNENLNETIEIVLKNIENSAIGFASEKCFSGLFKDFDFNSVNLGSTVQKRNENLMKLLNGVGEIDFGDFTNNSIDLLGDAYEFLMAMYAANAGKSGGEYFTPQEVSTLLTKICLIKYDGSQKDSVRKVYDPTCGSGSLLLKSAKILGKDNVDIGFFGQECNPTTYNLCRINMFLHNIPYEKFHISCEDTLVCPQHLGDQPFDVIVSNPPYSVKWVGDNDVTLINDPRFSPAGVLAPKSKADFAFIMHCLSCLSTDGKAAIVCSPGVLYRSGAEQKIRQYLVDNNFIDSIIQLPPNLFFGTGISTCILTLSKSKPDNNVLFIDASDEFIHVKNSNKLSDQNLANILSFYSERKDRQYISRLVTNDEISNKSYNLSVSSYVEKKSDEEEIDIIELNKKIKECHERNQRLCSEIDKIINEIAYKGGDSHAKADELIDKFCTNEVRFRPIWSLTAWDKRFSGVNPEKQKKIIKYKYITSSKFNKIERASGNIKYISTGISNKEKYTTEKLAGEYLCECEIVCIPGGGTPNVKYHKGKFVTGDNRIATSLDKNVLNNKFLYYYLNNIIKYISELYRGSAIKHPNMEEVLNLLIPIPHIEVQEEIVRILDRVTELENELENELEMRKRQYEFYRNKLLTFKEMAS